MTNPLLAVEWEPCALEERRDKTLEAYARRRLGVVPSFIPYFSACPWLVRAEANLNSRFGLLLHLDQTLADLVSMVVSQVNSCRYCYAASRLLLRLQGKSEGEVNQIEERLAEGWEDPRVETALRFARRIGRADPLPNERDREKVRAAGFSESELKELAYVAALTAFANRALTLPAIPPRDIEEAPDTRLFRWLRPFIAFWLNWYPNEGEPPDVEPSADTPYGYLSRAYSGMPIGIRLSQTFREAWTSDILTTRCKASLFAVVATALGCPHSLAEATRLLQDEGMADAEINNLLSHLQCDGLDSVESMLVPLARDTVWYRPAQIQRHAREVANAMSAEQFVEAIGVLALANATCRLGAAIGVPS